MYLLTLKDILIINYLVIFSKNVRVNQCNFHTVHSQCGSQAPDLWDCHQSHKVGEELFVDGHLEDHEHVDVEEENHHLLRDLFNVVQDMYHSNDYLLKKKWRYSHNNNDRR